MRPKLEFKQAKILKSLREEIYRLQTRLRQKKLDNFLSLSSWIKPSCKFEKARVLFKVNRECSRPVRAGKKWVRSTSSPAIGSWRHQEDVCWGQDLTRCQKQSLETENQDWRKFENLEIYLQDENETENKTNFEACFAFVHSLKLLDTKHDKLFSVDSVHSPLTSTEIRTQHTQSLNGLQYNMNHSWVLKPA